MWQRTDMEHACRMRAPTRRTLWSHNPRLPKLPAPPSNEPPTKMSQMMVIKNAFYRGEILATSTARLFPLVFDYPRIRFWHLGTTPT